MKKLILTALALFSIPVHADLNKGDKLAIQYYQAPIISFKSAEANVTYTPPNSTSVGLYEGQVIVTVVVEGNLCEADPKLAGISLRGSEEKTYIEVLYPQPAGRMIICKQYSKPTEISFPLAIYSYEMGQAIDESLGVIATQGDFVTGATAQEKELRFKGNAGKFEIVVVDLK